MWKASKETEERVNQIIWYDDMIIRRWFPHLFKD